MKKYIGTKEVKATPMSRGEYNQYRGWNIPANENPNDEGYLVEYTDDSKPNDERHEGYISWSPKDVFEKAYKPSETVLDRLRIEEDDLWDKATKCNCFVKSKDFRKIVTDKYQATLLEMQFYSMCEYLDILRLRIDGLTNKDNTKIKEDTWLSFGLAIQALHVGACIRRKDWNEGVFVVKQIPAHITKEVIPGMQSLPQSAKDIVLSRENKCIDYANQMLLMQPDGTADSWTPSSSDVFAEDWEIALSE